MVKNADSVVVHIVVPAEVARRVAGGEGTAEDAEAISAQVIGSLRRHVKMADTLRKGR